MQNRRDMDGGGVVEAEEYRAKDYWEARLSRAFNLRGVGHIGFNERYNRWLYRRKSGCLTECLAGVDLRDKHVLDVGCGTGFFVAWYLQRGARVTGLDITEVSIRELRTRFPGRFEVGDIASDALPVSGSFDVVNAWDVLYHIVDDEKLGVALRNICRLLKRGGLLIVDDAFGRKEDRMVASHVKFRSAKTYQALVRDLDLGLTLRSVHPLYRLLNRRLLGPADNYAAPVWYALDRLQKRPSRSGLSAAVWTRS